MTSITADLKLVVPLRFDADGAATIHGYHSPISREIYEANHRLLRDTKVALLGTSARHAYAARGDAVLYLRDAGKALAAEREDEGDGGVAAILAEIKRGTTILVPGANGWDMLPVDSAIAQGHIDADEWADGEAAIVFFISWLAGTPRRETMIQANLAASLIASAMTSSTAMEWRASSPTSTTDETSEGKAASSVPS